MIEALRAHPSIAGATHEAIRCSCEGHEKPEVCEMSLMLQRLEAEMLRVAVPVLHEHGFEVGAFIADGLLVRPTRADATSKLTAALAAIEKRIRAELEVTATMEIEHGLRV